MPSTSTSAVRGALNLFATLFLTLFVMADEIIFRCPLAEVVIKSMREIPLGLMIPVSEYSLSSTPGSKPSPRFFLTPDIVLPSSLIASTPNSSAKSSARCGLRKSNSRDVGLLPRMAMSSKVQSSCILRLIGPGWYVFRFCNASACLLIASWTSLQIRTRSGIGTRPLRIPGPSSFTVSTGFALFSGFCFFFATVGLLIPQHTPFP